MNDSKKSTYGEDLVGVVVTVIAIVVVLAVLYGIFRYAGWLGLNWG